MVSSTHTSRNLLHAKCIRSRKLRRRNWFCNGFKLGISLLLGPILPLVLLICGSINVQAQSIDATYFHPLTRYAFSLHDPTQSLELGANAVYTPPVYSPAVKTWGGVGADTNPTRIAVDSGGNIYVVGQFKGTVNFDPAHLNATASATSANNTYDAFLVKFDSRRNFLWVRTWGGSAGRDAANGVDVDNNGNAYVAGLYQGTVDFGSGYVYTSNAMPPLLVAPDNNIFVAKFNSAGVTQWAHTWGGTKGGEGYSIVVDRLNNAVYVQGDWSTYTNTIPVDFNQNDPAHPALRYSNGFYDAFLSKFDLNGNFVWNNTWGGHGYDDGTTVAVDSLGNVYVCGMYGSTDINFDPEGSTAGLGHGHGAPTEDWNYVNVFLSKFDAQGKFKWVRTWGGMNSDDAGGGVIVDKAGNVYAGGRFNCTNCNFNGDPLGVPVTLTTAGFHDGFVSKYDASGNFLWVKTWDDPSDAAVTGLALDSTGNIYATGWISGTPNNPANPNYGLKYGYAHIAGWTSDGTLLWAKTWGAAGTKTYNTPPIFDASGNIYLAGMFQSTVNFNTDGGTDWQTAVTTSPSFDAYLMKFFTAFFPSSLYLPMVTR